MKEDEGKNPINKIFDSIDKLLSDGKEQKLRKKLGHKIHDCIFTDEITKKFNEKDSSFVDQEDEIMVLFSMIFPVFVHKNDVRFRLYKHKIEVDLSNEMSDRYIFMFSDGRLTSGLFQCFKLYDEEYIYGIKKIINIIPNLREAVLASLVSFGENINNQKMEMYKDTEDIAENNFNMLIDMINTYSDGINI